MSFNPAPQPTNFSVWQQGWCEAAEKCESPNFGQRPTDANIDLIVVHAISLPPGEFGNGAVQQLFGNQLDWEAHPYFQSIRGLQVSAHFFIERTGKVWQFVSCDQRAWHAGVSTWRGRVSCNRFSIGIELEGAETVPYTEAQYATLRLVLAVLMQRYPALGPDTIVGHAEIAPERKRDPGPAFDWKRVTAWCRLTG